MLSKGSGKRFVASLWHVLNGPVIGSFTYPVYKTSNNKGQPCASVPKNIIERQSYTIQ